METCNGEIKMIRARFKVVLPRNAKPGKPHMNLSEFHNNLSDFQSINCINRLIYTMYVLTNGITRLINYIIRSLMASMASKLH